MMSDSTNSIGGCYEVPADDANPASRAHTSVRIEPRTVVLTFRTSPAVSSSPTSGSTRRRRRPGSVTGVVGSADSVFAPSPQTINRSTCDCWAWSDGNTQSTQDDRRAGGEHHLCHDLWETLTGQPVGCFSRGTDALTSGQDWLCRTDLPSVSRRPRRGRGGRPMAQGRSAGEAGAAERAVSLVDT